MNHQTLQEPRKYKRPDDLPGRVCRVLEGYTLLEMESEEPLMDMVYRFTHIASGLCPHPDWMADFERMEAIVEDAVYTSPAERAGIAAGVLEG